MKLSDIMGGADLSGYAQIALVLFVIVFIAIIIRTWAPSRQKELDETAMIPLRDDNFTTRTPPSPRSQER